MSIGIRKLSTLCAAFVALFGLSSGTARAVTPQEMNGTSIAPLYLEHGSNMLGHSAFEVVAGHESHYSHSSHSSHSSHESHYSHYSGR